MIKNQSHCNDCRWRSFAAVLKHTFFRFQCACDRVWWKYYQGSMVHGIDGQSKLTDCTFFNRIFKKFFEQGENVLGSLMAMNIISISFIIGIVTRKNCFSFKVFSIDLFIIIFKLLKCNNWISENIRKTS